MTKVLICYTHITPRLVRRLEALAQRVPNLVILELAGSEAAYPWWAEHYEVSGVRQVALFDGHLEDLTQSQVKAAAAEFLEREKPDVAIVADYSRASMRFIAAWVRRRGGRTILPALTWAGAHRRWALKEWCKGWFIRRLFDAVCAGGERTYAYYAGLGFRPAQLWKQFNVVDNEHFGRGADAARAQGAALRQKLGLPVAYFLFVGAMEPWKNVVGLVEAHARYRKTGGKWALVMVGVGSQLELLQKKAAAAPGGLAILFAGLKSYEETPAYYGLASCLVLPSQSETWGLVVNEAAAAGLPLVVSNKCGCVPELVHRGINGYSFEPADPTELVRLLHSLSGGSLDLERMGQASRQLISYYTPERWADALADCIRNGAAG